MKKLFKKPKKLKRKHLHELAIMLGSVALLLMLAVFVRVGVPAVAHAWIIYPTMSYTPVYPGGYSTVSWSAPTSDWCKLYYYYSWGSAPISGQSCGSTGCGILVYGTSGSGYVGPVNSPSTYDLYCYNASGGIGSSWAQGSASITVSPSCPASSFGSPWNSNSYLIYSGGQGSVSNWYGRYCLHNYSGSAIFIPMATPTEWNDFSSRASAIGIGISSY